MFESFLSYNNISNIQLNHTPVITEVELPEGVLHTHTRGDTEARGMSRKYTKKNK